MSEVIKLYKEVGETPLECILRFKAAAPEYEKTKMTYLGRLDPMAEGLLLILAGDTRDKASYLALDKTYEFEVLWGFETDTFDTLGLVSAEGKTPDKLEQRMSPLVNHILKKKTQVYPLFSSKSFGGNFLVARDKKIEEADLVERSIKIFSLEHIHTRWETRENILAEIERRVSLVKGDFRQKEILEGWKNVLNSDKTSAKFLISKFSADVSSGTYIRSLAQEMGKHLGTSALAWSIKRTRVGEYKI
jgi:tRNA pseudouridine55 synthase